MSIQTIYSATSTTSPASLLTQKGQILSHTGTISAPMYTDTSGKLVVQSAQSVGMSWSTASVQNVAYWNPIASSVLTADTTTVTFSSIPQTYSHLCVIARCRSKESSSTIFGGMRINGNQSVVYFNVHARSGGSGASTSSGSTTGQDGMNQLFVNATASATASSFGSFEIFIPGYTASRNMNVNAVSFGETASSTQVCQTMFGGASCLLGAAVTSISFYTINAHGWLTGSSFQLYGIG